VEGRQPTEEEAGKVKFLQMKDIIFDGFIESKGILE
jgi:hypothetical protein